MDKFDLISDKIISGDKLAQKLAVLRFKERKIVFTNGCFDILHRGHIEYIAKAASQGDEMIVGLNSDKSVRNIKGESRPVQDEETRALILASLEFVSYVVLFNEDTPYNIIKQIQPDVLVKGDEYKAEDIVGYDIVSAKRGKIVTIKMIQGHSTTGILNRILKD